MIFFGLGVWQTYVVVSYRRFSPTAILKAIRRKPYCGRVPLLSSPFKLTVRFLFSDLKSRLPNSAAGMLFLMY
ncbi:unnamed protein product [Brassica rapa subsp. trilocularis]